MLKKISIITVLLLSGCSSTSSEAPANPSTAVPVIIAANSQLQLSVPPAEKHGKSLATKITMSYGKSSAEMMLEVHFTDQTIEMRGTDPEGAQLFEMQWSKGAPFRISKSPMAKELDLKQLLADFQLVHWPAAQLSTNLIGATLQQDGTVRTVFQGSTPKILIEHHNGVTALEHLERRYRLTFKLQQHAKQPNSTLSDIP